MKTLAYLDLLWCQLDLESLDQFFDAVDLGAANDRCRNLRATEDISASNLCESLRLASAQLSVMQMAVRTKTHLGHRGVVFLGHFLDGLVDLEISLAREVADQTV